MEIKKRIISTGYQATPNIGQLMVSRIPARRAKIRDRYIDIPNM
jgi:hypothetical protein